MSNISGISSIAPGSINNASALSPWSVPSPQTNPSFSCSPQSFSPANSSALTYSDVDLYNFSVAGGVARFNNAPNTYRNDISPRLYASSTGTGCMEQSSTTSGSSYGNSNISPYYPQSPGYMNLSPLSVCSPGKIDGLKNFENGRN